MGIIVLAVAILPLLGVGGRSSTRPNARPDEGHQADAAHHRDRQGPLAGVLPDRGLPASLALPGPAWAGSMPLIHTFTTMGLGGFSSHDASFGYFDSPRSSW
jgi:trk system potassium uptake protein TrkH